MGSWFRMLIYGSIIVWMGIGVEEIGVELIVWCV
jgi:hypothetical protein